MARRLDIRQQIETEIAAREAERDSIIEELDALVAALAALDGTDRHTSNGHGRARKTPSVGDDKVQKVKDYIFERVQVRQAELKDALGLNAGTTSTAVRRLEAEGVIVRGPKVDRSITWRAADSAR